MSMWNLRSLAECLLATPKGAPINEYLARDLARAAVSATSTGGGVDRDAAVHGQGVTGATPAVGAAVSPTPETKGAA